MRPWQLFSGTANPALASAIARTLDTELGSAKFERFPDGEVGVTLGQSVRGHDVVVVQPTCAPVNDHLVELLAFADACRRAGAARVIAVIPYFGYARADRRHGRRCAIMARVAADAIEGAGISQVLTVDLHAPAIEGFFRIPVDDLSAVATLCDALIGRLRSNTVVVSPDLGRIETAAQFGRRLACPVAVVHKRRLNGAEVQADQLIGDVRGRPCLIIDDMISTGATVVQCINMLRSARALDDFTVAATHGVFSAGAQAALLHAGVRDIVVTDSIPPQPVDSVRIASIAPLLASSIQRLLAGEPLHELRMSSHADLR